MKKESTGKRIKRLREGAGLTQEGLAALVGVGWSIIPKWEADKHRPHPERLKALAKALGVPVGELE